MAKPILHRNSEVDRETVVWAASTDPRYVSMPLGNLAPVLIYVDNGVGQTLTVNFEYKIGDDDVGWYDSSNNEMEFTVPASTKRVFGPFEYFPRFSGGRLKIVPGAAPVADDETLVVIQEV